MLVTEITQPDEAALPLARLRDHLRLSAGFADDGAQDALLTGFLRAALAAVEARSGKVLMEREFDWVVTGWRDGAGVALPLAPVSAIVAATIAGQDVAGQLRLEPDSTAPMLRPVGSSLPVVSAGQSARLRLLAGYGPEFSDIPADLQQAVLLLAAHYHDYRSETDLPGGCMPFGVSALIERYRPIRMGLST